MPLANPPIAGLYGICAIVSRLLVKRHGKTHLRGSKRCPHPPCPGADDNYVIITVFKHDLLYFIGRVGELEGQGDIYVRKS